MEKAYPINYEQHAHDFSYVCDILFNRAYDLRVAGKDEQADRLEAKRDKIWDTVGRVVKTARTPRGDRVFWYCGKDFAFLRNVIEFAHNSRARAIAIFECEK